MPVRAVLASSRRPPVPQVFRALLEDLVRRLEDRPLPGRIEALAPMERARRGGNAAIARPSAFGPSGPGLEGSCHRCDLKVEVNRRAGLSAALGPVVCPVSILSEAELFPPLALAIRVSRHRRTCTGWPVPVCVPSQTGSPL